MRRSAPASEDAIKRRELAVFLRRMIGPRLALKYGEYERRELAAELRLVKNSAELIGIRGEELPPQADDFTIGTIKISLAIFH